MSNKVILTRIFFLLYCMCLSIYLRSVTMTISFLNSRLKPKILDQVLIYNSSSIRPYSDNSWRPSILSRTRYFILSAYFPVKTCLLCLAYPPQTDIRLFCLISWIWACFLIDQDLAWYRSMLLHIIKWRNRSWCSYWILTRHLLAKPTALYKIYKSKSLSSLLKSVILFKSELLVVMATTSALVASC